MTNMALVSKFPNPRRPRSKSVSGARWIRRVAICANSVASPVATTTHVAVPLRTLVPRKTQLVRADIGVDAGIAPGCFWTGKLSPVNADSLTNRSPASSTTASAGTRLPALNFTRSPTTTAVRAIDASRPSRRTTAPVCTRARRAATARSARYSRRYPTATVARTMASTMVASLHSRATAEMVEAKISSQSNGLRICRRRTRDRDRTQWSRRSAGPDSRRRRSASADERPAGFESSCVMSAAAGTDQ